MATDIIGKDRERRYKAMLILKYDRLDFFNHRIYTEDKKDNYTRDDLKKVFAFSAKHMMHVFRLIMSLCIGIV